MSQEAQPGEKLYRELAQRLIADISSGIHRVGERLPGERELALQYGVSRATVREAVIVLEVLGIVEVRIGSGTRILQGDGGRGSPSPKVSAFEVAEALLMIEGEAAALAAREIGAREIAEIEELVRQLGRRRPSSEELEAIEREFHLAIARASRNYAVYDLIARLWDLRTSSPEASSIRSDMSSTMPLVVEYTAVLDALRRADSDGARTAMRAHLATVLDGLLFAAEKVAVAQARRATEAQRSRYTSARISS